MQQEKKTIEQTNKQIKRNNEIQTTIISSIWELKKRKKKHKNFPNYEIVFEKRPCIDIMNANNKHGTELSTSYVAISVFLDGPFPSLSLSWSICLR